MEALDTFLPANAGERKTLADLIFAKLDSGEVTSTAAIKKVHQGRSMHASHQGVFSPSHFIDHDAPDPAAGLNPAVVEAYTK